MSSSAVLGQYLWHELLTPDPEAGAGFYSKVLGWNKVPYEGDAGYTMLGNAQGPVGGARVVGKDPLADKAGPSWLTYVGVPDLPIALAAVEAKGGRVLHPMTSVPGDGGRYAVIVDPQGATIGVYEPAAMSGGAAAAAGPVVWHELTAANPEAALQFYNAIFGWEVVATHEMGGEVGTYYLFGQGATQKGGAYAVAKGGGGSGPRWLVYLSVPSVTAAVEAAKAAGGKVLNPPHQVPGGSWIAQLLDSHGVAVAVHGPKEAADAAPKAAPSPKAHSKVKSKAKPAPAKTKSKTARKPPSKAKSKTTAKRKVAAQSRVNPKTKRAAKAKPKVKTKAKTKAKVKTKTKTKTKTKKKGADTPPQTGAARQIKGSAGLLALCLAVVKLLGRGLLRCFHLVHDAIFRLLGLLCLLHFSRRARAGGCGGAGQSAACAQARGEDRQRQAQQARAPGAASLNSAVLHGDLLAHFR